MVTNNPIPAKGGSLIGATTIDWEDVYKGDNVMWRVPRNIKWGDNVVVREDETAVFFRDGKVLAYLDKPDRYSLTSLNARVLGNLVQALSGVRQEAEIYYLQRRTFDGKFGSQEPYVFRDPDFGLVEPAGLRRLPLARFRTGPVHQPVRRNVRGREPGGRREPVARPDGPADVRDARSVEGPGDAGDRPRPQAHDDRAGGPRTGPDALQPVRDRGPADPRALVNLPDEVQKAVNTRSTMGVLGVNYMQYQAGQAMTTAAANPSGGAGALTSAGVGLGPVSGWGTA